MRTNLSQLELFLLSALVSKERYGLEIIEVIEDATGRKGILSLGSLYATLHRMEKKGFITSRWGETVAPRQGARRRYYRLTALGEEALRETQRVLVTLLRLAPT
jgi:PadR family transcriptional regulator, regulatory protein PadR